jgi:hypothetical protein
MDATQKEALNLLGDVFEDRIRRRLVVREAEAEGRLSYALPASAEEIELLSEIGERFCVPLVAQGAGTALEAGSERGTFLIGFDPMRRVRLPADPEEPGPKRSRGRCGWSWTTTCTPGGGASPSIPRAPAEPPSAAGWSRTV